MQDSTVVTVESAKGAAEGSVKLKTVPREQAVQKAVVALVACWGIAALTVPIPIVHFIAPPLLLLAGPLVAFLVFKMFNGATDVTGGEVPCPDCGKPQLLGPSAAAWPLTLECNGCAARLSIRPSAGPSR